MAKGKDFYQVLGISKTADAKEIQSAYRKLARKHHPDLSKDPGAEDRFKQISEAYDVLSDPKSRAKYDRLSPHIGDDWDKAPDDFDPRARPWSSGEGAQWTTWEDGVPFGDTDFPLGDLFGGIFGGRQQRGSKQGTDQQTQVEISLAEAYSGTSRRISLNGPGTGQSFTAKIPAGVTDGQKIRLSGKGSPGPRGAPAGDLYLIMHILPDPRFTVQGRNILAKIDVAPWEAALGSAVSIPTPNGSTKIKIPAGSSSGRKLRIAGQGIPNPSGSAGDLMAEIRIVVPQQLNDEERTLFEQLASASRFTPRGES